MAVYNIPKEFESKLPELDFQNFQNYEPAWNKFVEELKAWCKSRNDHQEYVGEVLSFPVADGSALYMVAAISPVQLLHLPYLDNWRSQTAEFITKKSQLVPEIKRQLAIKELFARKKK